METCTKLWVESEKEQLAEVMRGYGIEWEKLGTHEQHLDVLEYKKKMRAREVAVLESKVSETDFILKARQQILSDADTAIDRLDKEFAEKTDAVEALNSEIEDKTAELETTSEQLAVNQQLLQESAEKVTQIEDIDSINIKRSMLGDKVTLSEMDYNSIVELAKKELAAEHDTADKDDEIYRLNEILQAMNKEKALWADERSALHKTIDRLKAQVRGLTDQLSALKAKYDKVMEFIEKFDLKEKLDNFLHPIKNIKKHKR
jgi:chromosome segregation ATPase